MLGIRVVILALEDKVFLKAACRYHKMSLQYHPDKVGGGPDATKKFNEIKSAREFLGCSLGGWSPVQ